MTATFFFVRPPFPLFGFFGLCSTITDGNTAAGVGVGVGAGAGCDGEGASADVGDGVVVVDVSDGIFAGKAVGCATADACDDFPSSAED